MTPLISVLMPVYNGQRYLAEAVQSIVQQTFKDFEFLMVDDGSTDDSLAMVTAFASQDKRIRLIPQRHQGLVAALNQGLAQAKGLFIARMDADDISLPERFDKQVAFLLAHPECAVVGSRLLAIDPKGRPLNVQLDRFSHEAIDAAHIQGLGGAIPHPAAMMRTDALKEVQGYRNLFPHVEDLDLWFRLTDKGYRLANLEAVLLKYRHQFHSVSHENRTTQDRNRHQVTNEARARRGLKPLLDRPSSPPLTRARTYLQWSQWALAEGHLKTALHYATLSCLKEPYRRSAWRLLAREAWRLLKF